MREIRMSGCASSEGWCVQQEINLPGEFVASANRTLASGLGRIKWDEFEELCDFD